MRSARPVTDISGCATFGEGGRGWAGKFGNDTVDGDGAGRGDAGEELDMLEFGGVRPDDRMGSDEPVSKDAAVAAAATLKKMRYLKKRKEISFYSPE